MIAFTTEPPLQSILQALADAIGTREKVLLGELTDSLGRRGFGPVILLASAMMVLPTGMVPGVPAFMGVILLLAGGQMLSGRHELWLPPKIYGIVLPGPALRRGIVRAEPLALRLSRWLRLRWLFLVNGFLSRWLIALILIVTSGVIIIIGAIPGLPFLLALHLLAFGLGLTVGDGVFVAAGYGIFLPAVALAGHLSGFL
ncbi:exopolysaccharide biosynthesis protein [Aliiruegeria sabulilitoris]|uniref:exopolysaccharide biosynthesis protein n=1 Tax=Aliiruegeria sabulilitoris TaxID=1510458 RepID=UPI0008379419|nr:exopolysaccharide biosynthesis protein [Aliiruegeria sabulilitoris]NDR56381.1 exopolysaccharide biosynthesis protein [Pseudoruegeria sp. M32A2M]